MFERKRLFCIFIVCIFIICTCFNVVKASEYGEIMPLDSQYEDSLIFREVKNRGYDEATNSYIIDYKIYNSGGLQEGSVYIANDIYNLSSWFLLCLPDGSLKIYVDGDTSENISTVRVVNGLSRIYFNKNKYWIYSYESSTNSFSLTSEVNSDMMITKRENIYANNILFTRNCIINFCGYNGATINYSICSDYQDFMTPSLKYKVNEGFRLYLNDFHSSTIINDIYEIVNSLSNLMLYVYDLNTHMYLTENSNLLEFSDVCQDTEGNYYIDIPFNGLLDYMNTVNGDYVIGVISLISANKYVYEFDNINGYTMNTIYSSYDYWRYQYFSSSGTGVLVPSDAERKS